MRRAWAVAGFVALSAIWGTQYLVIQRGQLSVPPLMTVALRFAIVAAVGALAVVATRARAPEGSLPGRLLFAAAQALSMGLLYWGAARVGSAVVGLLVATTPLFILLLAHAALPDERLTLRSLSAVGLGLGGAALLIPVSEVDPDARLELAGALAVLLSAAAGATNKVVAKRLCAAVPVPVLLRDMGLVVAVLAALGSRALEADATVVFTAAQIAAFAWLGLVASAGASSLYLLMLRHVRVTLLSHLQLVTAVVALAAGVFVGGERLHLGTVLGAIAILCGLIIHARAGSPGASRKVGVLPP